MLSPRFKKSLKIHRKTPLRESLFRKGRRLTTIQNNYLLINSEKLLLGIVVIHLASCLAFSPKNGLYNTPNIFKFNLFKVFYFTLKWLFVRCRDRDEVHHILQSVLDKTNQWRVFKKSIGWKSWIFLPTYLRYCTL